METILSDYPEFDFKYIHKDMSVNDACRKIIEDRFDLYTKLAKKDLGISSLAYSSNNMKKVIDYCKAFDTLDELITLLNNNKPLFNLGELIRWSEGWSNKFVMSGPNLLYNICYDRLLLRKYIKALERMEKDLYKTFETYTKLYLGNSENNSDILLKRETNVST